MCFSATASFSAAAVLTAVGTVSISANRGPAPRMFAVIPLLFAAQQFAEGLVWTTMGVESQTRVHGAAVQAFLTFALVVWPTWVPVALLRMEKDPTRVGLLRLVTAIGLVVSSVGTAVLIHWPPHAQIAARSVCYDFGLPADLWGRAAFLPVYVVPTVLPFMVTSLALARPMGAAMLTALITTLIVREAAVTSVWCFFAGLLSTLILVSLRREKRAAVATVVPAIAVASPVA